MAEYIERETLKERITAEKDAHDTDTPYWAGYNNGLTMAYAMVVAMPAADVEVVVRCGECARRYTELCALYAGQMNGKSYFIQQGDDFFCKKGQRWEVDDG